MPRGTVFNVISPVTAPARPRRQRMREPNRVFRQAREDLEMNQRDYARALWISQGSVVAFEHGRMIPDTVMFRLNTLLARHQANKIINDPGIAVPECHMRNVNMSIALYADHVPTCVRCLLISYGATASLQHAGAEL